MDAGKMKDRVQFMRATLVDDGFSQAETFTNYGALVWAERQDASDGERWRAGEVSASITTRFRLLQSAFTRGITTKDRLACRGVTYDISGIKETEWRGVFEITAAARAD